ncbi:MAG: hypothetical protein AVO38_00185 [delta proteobacterium ML8_D]|jgi:uncharacterized protein with PQ loop repeat|nr:MAG: hypothetical protein AVO38_00185 [delta proteobacterium ML8_D]
MPLELDSYPATSVAFFLFSFFAWIYEGYLWWLIFGILITIIYSIKSYGLLKSYYTENRRDVSPVIKKNLNHFLKECKT